MWTLKSQSKVSFPDKLVMLHLINTSLLREENSHISYLERFESIGEGDAKATANIFVEALDGSREVFCYRPSWK